MGLFRRNFISRKMHGLSDKVISENPATSEYADMLMSTKKKMYANEYKKEGGRTKKAQPMKRKLYDTKEKKAKAVRKKGNIITFKEKFYPRGTSDTGHSQILVTGFSKQRGSVRIEGRAYDSKWYDSIDSLIKAVDWKKMESWHSYDKGGDIENDRVDIKVYQSSGEKQILDNVSLNKIKTNIAKQNYDGTYTMKNGDLVEIIKSYAKGGQAEKLFNIDRKKGNEISFLDVPFEELDVDEKIDYILELVDIHNSKMNRYYDLAGEDGEYENFKFTNGANPSKIRNQAEEIEDEINQRIRDYNKRHPNEWKNRNLELSDFPLQYAKGGVIYGEVEHAEWEEENGDFIDEIALVGYDKDIKGYEPTSTERKSILKHIADDEKILDSHVIEYYTKKDENQVPYIQIAKIDGKPATIDLLKSKMKVSKVTHFQEGGSLSLYRLRWIEYNGDEKYEYDIPLSSALKRYNDYREDGKEVALEKRVDDEYIPIKSFDSDGYSYDKNDEQKTLKKFLRKTKEGKEILKKSKNIEQLKKEVLKYHSQKGIPNWLFIDNDYEGIKFVAFAPLYELKKYDEGGEIAESKTKKYAKKAGEIGSALWKMGKEKAKKEAHNARRRIALSVLMDTTYKVDEDSDALALNKSAKLVKDNYKDGGMLKYYIGDVGTFQGGEYEIQNYSWSPKKYAIKELDERGRIIGPEYNINQVDFEKRFTKLYCDGGEIEKGMWGKVLMAAKAKKDQYDTKRATMSYDDRENSIFYDKGGEILKLKKISSGEYVAKGIVDGHNVVYSVTKLEPNGFNYEIRIDGNYVYGDGWVGLRLKDIKQSMMSDIYNAIQDPDSYAKGGKIITELFSYDFPFDYTQTGNKIVIHPEGYNKDGTLFEMKDDWKEKIIRTFQEKIPSADAKPNMGGGITIHIKEMKAEGGRTHLPELSDTEYMTLLEAKGFDGDYENEEEKKEYLEQNYFYKNGGEISYLKGTHFVFRNTMYEIKGVEKLNNNKHLIKAYTYSPQDGTTENTKYFGYETLVKNGIEFEDKPKRKSSKGWVTKKTREKWDAELDALKYDLSGEKAQLKDLYFDMEQEAGQKGDDWSDADANRYGGEMNEKEENIEKYEKRIKEIKEHPQYDEYWHLNR